MSLSKDFMNGECTDKQGIEVFLSIREIMLCTFLVHKGVLARVVCILRFCLHRKQKSCMSRPFKDYSKELFKHISVKISKLQSFRVLGFYYFVAKNNRFKFFCH